MIVNNEKISNGQMFAIIINSTIGVGILSLPRLLAEGMGTDGWILVVISLVIVILLTLMITFTAKLFPGKTMVEFGRELVTTPISDIFSIIYFIYLVVFAAFVVRIFGEIVKMYLLSKTPIEFIIISMLFVVAYLSRGGIESIAKISVLLIPVILFPVLFMSFVLLPDMDFTNILPMFKFSIKDVTSNIIDVFFSFAGFEIILFYTAFVEKPNKAIKYNLVAVIIIAAIYLIVFLLALFTFGEIEITHQIWPSISLMETVDFPGAFIENVQGFFMAQWTLVIFSTLISFVFGASLILCKLFRANEQKYFVLPLIPIVYILSLIPDNIAASYDYVSQATYYLGTLAIIIIPILLFISVIIKKRNRKGEADNG